MALKRPQRSKKTKKERKKHPIETTFELVNVIKSALPKFVLNQKGHPAKQVFQAIRIEVNDELGQLERAVDEFCDVLADKGRLCIITFHSLEDRIVKTAFRTMADPCTCPKNFPVCVCGKKPTVKVLGGGGVKPSKEEIAVNARSRSAMLRGCVKL